MDEVSAYADAKIPKVVRIFPGVFTEWLPFYKSPQKTLEIVGTGDEKFSTTALIDVARSVVQLSLLLKAPTEPEKGTADIPTYVHISGTAVTFNEAAKLTGKELKLTSINDARVKYKELLEAGGHSFFASFMVMLMCFIAEGWLDHTKDNHNELVNPRGSRWKWGQWQDFAPK